MERTSADKGIFWIFFIAVITQRLAFPVGGTQLPIALPIYLAMTIFLCFTNKLAIKRALLMCVLGVLSLLFITCLLASRPFSITSLLYLCSLYLPFCLGPITTENIDARPVDGFKWFSTMMCGFAAVAIWQYASQAYLGIPYFDPLNLLPASFQIEGYVVTYPIIYGSPIYKSNAYFFLEPSFLSQFMALALLIEILVFRRVIVMGMQVLALACTFSGTGLLLIAVTLPIAVLFNLSNRRVVVGSGICALLVIAAVVSNPTVLDRAGELDSQDSSGSMRFSTPYERLTQLSLNSASDLLVGYGAGAVDRLKGGQIANFPAIPKAVIEYGLIGGLPLLALIAIRIFGAVRHFPIAFGLFCMQFFLSGALLQPISIFLLFYFFSFKPPPDSDSIIPFVQYV